MILWPVADEGAVQVLVGLRGTGNMEVDHGMSMRRKGEMIGKLGEQFFALFLNGLPGGRR